MRTKGEMITSESSTGQRGHSGIEMVGLGFKGYFRASRQSRREGHCR